MPDIRDFLPPLPWEGPPVPKGLIRSKYVEFGEDSLYKYFLIFLPTEYFSLRGWKIPSNVITADGASFGQTSRAVTAATFEEGAVKYVESIRDPLHGWRNIIFDKFALQIHAGASRDVKIFPVDDIIEECIEKAKRIPGKLTPEFFARRGIGEA